MNSDIPEEYRCRECSGNGYIECPECQGSGEDPDSPNPDGLN